MMYKLVEKNSRKFWTSAEQPHTNFNGFLAPLTTGYQSGTVVWRQAPAGEDDRDLVYNPATDTIVVDASLKAARLAADAARVARKARLVAANPVDPNLKFSDLQIMVKDLIDEWRGL